VNVQWALVHWCCSGMETCLTDFVLDGFLGIQVAQIGELGTIGDENSAVACVRRSVCELDRQQQAAGTRPVG
jgi:hypothetical protein